MEKKDQILAALKQLNGCAIGAIDTITEVKLLGGKKNPMLNKVTKKVTGGNVMFFCNINSNGYYNMVNRRLSQEGKEADFKLSPRAWGERVPNTPFVVHKGKVYVEVIYLKAPKNIEYLLEGNPIDKTEIQGLPENKEGDQGGLNNKVIIRTYDVESITGLKMGDLSVI